MTSNERPQPEPRGALVPPRRYPPTAIGTDTPEPPPPHRARHVQLESSGKWVAGATRMVNTVLDALDVLADNVAKELRMR